MVHVLGAVPCETVERHQLDCWAPHERVRLPVAMLATAHVDLTATWWLSFRYTLMFNASYLCRLQFVLAYNYLLMIKTDALSGHKTAFEKYVLRALLWHRRDVALC